MFTDAELDRLPHLVFLEEFFLDEDNGEFLAGPLLVEDIAQVRLVHEFEAAKELPDGLVGKSFLQFQRLVKLLLGYELVTEEYFTKFLFFGHVGAVFLTLVGTFREITVTTDDAPSEAIFPPSRMPSRDFRP